jgi:cytochrome P450
MIPKPNTLVGPKGHFLLGNLPEFRKDPLGFLTRCAKEYSEIVPLRMLHLPIYLLLNPEYIEYVLSTHGRDFVKPRLFQIAKGFLREGLILSEGDAWLRQRRLMQPAFHKNRTDAYGQIMVEYTERLIASWQAGQTVNLSQAMSRLAMEIVVKALLNYDVSNDREGMGQAFNVVVDEVTARFNNPVPIPDNVPTPGNLRYRRAIKYLDTMIYRIIRHRQAHPEDQGDLLSMLLQARYEDGSPMTDEQLRDETITIFVAGHDTTATTLSWCWYLLSQHPEVEAKLMAELESVLGGRAPTAADLPQLRYTEMIVMETLRLYQPTPILGRTSIKEVELGGHHFPAGTEFLIVPMLIHHSSRYYESPEEFQPERWEGDLLKRLPKFAYMPFSHGPRLCLGGTFATMEAKLIVATIAQRFHLQLAPGEVVVPKFSALLRTEEPIKMVVTERRPASQLTLPARSVSRLPVEL